MKRLILFAAVFFIFSATNVFADYTIDLKNESGTVIKTYIVTVDQVQHLQKVAAVTGKSVVNQIKEAILDIISQAKRQNKERWRSANDAYVDEQSRL